MDLRRQFPQRWLREALAPRAPSLVIVALIGLFGLYPGPFLLLRSSAWRNDYVAIRFVDERAFWIAGLLVIVTPAIVLANLMAEPFDRAWNWIRSRSDALRDGWFVTGAAVFATVAAATAAVYVLSRRPTTSDEVAQLWHAKILLSGRLWLPPDPNPEFFAIDNVVDQGRWYSQFPLGGPAIFALATPLHAAWLVNPLLAGLTVANVYRFALRAYGAAEARVSAALCATCPFLLMMSGSYMNHTAVAFLTTLALAEVPAWVSTGTRRKSAAAIIGLSLGMAVTIRPLDGAIAALPFGAFLVVEAARRRQWQLLVVAAAAGAIPIAGLLVVNALTTGRPLLFGYEVLWGANHSLGFHNDPSGNPHTPRRALELMSVYLMQLNWSLFEWPVAGLVVFGVALVAIGKLGRWDTLLVTWIAAQLVAYAAYWHAGNLFGPRYLFTVVPACLIIVARGLTAAERNASPSVRRSIVTGTAVSLLAAWLVPFTPVGVIGAAKSVRPTRLAFKLDLEPAIRSLNGGKALIFVSETATARLMRRMWGLGIARPDAARLAATKDNCSLLDAVLDEEQRAGSRAERLARLEASKPYAPPPGWRLMVTDMAFRTSNRESITTRCRAELLFDGHLTRAISYGPALLRNEIGRDGHIAGPVVFVADLAEHNERLRARFGDRPWYRMEVPRGGTQPQLVPYQ